MAALLLAAASLSAAYVGGGALGLAAPRDAARAAPQMMPIGVPKVAYKIPGASTAQWIDIYNRLYRERIIFLGQEVDDAIANQIIAVMLFMESEEAGRPIHLYVNSPGGSVIAGLAMCDTMGHISSEVATINVGMSASMASFILGAGERGKRLALPHSRVMIHQPMGGSQGQAEDIKMEAKQILKIKETLVTMYAQMTGQTRERIIKDLSRDNYMSAQQVRRSARPWRPGPRPNAHEPLACPSLTPRAPARPCGRPERSRAQALEYGLIDKIVELQPGR